MLVSIIGKDTYKVGEKVLKVGDEINLAEVSDIAVPDIGSIPAEKLRAKLIALNTWIRDTKQWLLNSLNICDDAYNEKLAVTCWDYVNAYRDWAFYVDILFKAIEKSLGGAPPLQIDPDSGKITVRQMKRDPREAMGESLNWTADMINRQIQFHRYEGVRAVITKLEPKATVRAFMTFDVKLLAKLGVPVITIPTMHLPLALVGDTAALAKAGTDAFEMLQSQVPICLIWTMGDTHYFIDMKEKVTPNQPGAQPAPLAATISDLRTKLGKPLHVSLMMFGDLSHIVKGKRGLVAAAIDAAGDSHCAMSVEGEAFAELSKGSGLKLEETLATSLKQLIAEEKK